MWFGTVLLKFIKILLPCSINGALIDVQVTCAVPYFELCSTSFLSL